MESFSIAAIQISDFKAIKEIADECFGKDYLTENQLNKLIGSKGAFLKVVDRNQTIGFSFTLWNHELEELIIKNINYSTAHITLPFGVIKTIAIKTDFQNQGFGSRLIEASIHQMKSMFGAKIFLYLAWTESKSYQFTSKLMKLGFRTVEIIPNYWYNESLKLNYGCLRCGNPPCNCSLTLFKLTI